MKEWQETKEEQTKGGSRKLGGGTEEVKRRQEIKWKGWREEKQQEGRKEVKQVGGLEE